MERSCRRRLLAAIGAAIGLGVFAVSAQDQTASATASMPSPICATQPAGGRVPGALLTGARLRSVAVDAMTGHAFVLTSGDYATGNRHICTTSLLTLDARTGELLYRTRLGAGTGPAATPSLAVHGPSHRLFAVDADYTAPGHPARPSVAIVDMRNGQRLRSLWVGGNPGSIAVDLHTYRAFVSVNANLPLPETSVAVIAVTKGAVLRKLPLAAQDIVVDQRTNRVFLLTSQTVTTVDGGTGSVLRTVKLPAGYYQYNGAGVDESTGRLFVSQLGLAPPHSGNPGNPPNALSLIDSRTGALLRTILASSQSPLGTAVVDEPVGLVVTWPTNTDSTAASVLDARDGRLRARVTLGLPRGGLQGPVTVDPRNGDIYGYTSQGIRAIQPGRWLRSKAVSSQTNALGQSLAVSSATGVLFGVQWNAPSSYIAVGYCTIRAGCRARAGK